MKKLLQITVLVFFSIVSNAQVKSSWQNIDENTLESKTKVRRTSFPKEFKIWKLDVQNLKDQLKNAPVRGNFEGVSNVIIQLPNASGQLERFRVLETLIMEEALASKFPNIKSYVGKGIDDVTATARFSMTEFGLHSMTLSAGKSTSFIDPFTEDAQNYIVYSRSSLGQNAQSFECLTSEKVHLPTLENDRRANAMFRATDDKKLRTYRLALSCTAEYGNIFRGNSTDPTATQKGRIQAQMAITMTRVNGVYENDLAITMIFVANNDALIYLGNINNDPWTNEYNVRTGQTIDANIGFNSYDIGHNFNTTGGGNAGCVGCVCSPDTNAGGGFHKGTAFTGRANPTGDPFDIDYVAHEMGHQFGGYHTQSSSACRSGSGATEVEPGSGSTIMAYAGICSTNVQNNSDAYFAYVNIRDIMQNVKSGISQPTLPMTNLSNNPPTANAGKDYVIPNSTAFMLVGQASDPENDPLTYTWEQNDPQNPGTTAPPDPTRVEGPMFRSVWGTNSPVRFMPDMGTILTGNTSNTWEVCPSVARDLNFSLTVRDNNNSGIGQTATDLMKVTVDGVAGPFVVTSPNTVISWQVGTVQNVTWNVAGTDSNGVNAKFVDIYLSTNGGTSYPILLASKVPNDGSEAITVPNNVGTINRIMVKGWDNIFFDVSNTNFTITAPASTMAISFNGIEGGQNKSICKGANISYTIKHDFLAGFSGTTSFVVSGSPSGTTVAFSPSTLSNNGNVEMTISNTSSATPGFYPLVVTATAGSVTKTARFYLDLLNSEFGTSTLTSPANNAVGQDTSLNLTWVANSSASLYDVQVATDSGFTNIIASATSTTNSYRISGLSQGTDYYWKIMPKNAGCIGDFSSISKFTTGAITCRNPISSSNVPLTIPTQANVTVDSNLNIPSGGIINDVNIFMDVTHSWINDVTATLISPAGTQVQLFVRPCAGSQDVIATFDDSGSDVLCGSIPGIVGTVKSSQLLSAFNGQNSTGNWTLRIFDGFNRDGGSLNSWSLSFCTVQALDLEEVESGISDLIIYPNPNNGNFNLQFTSNSSIEIRINIHDIGGREIFNKSYNNNGLFNELLHLGNLQSGVYLVTVQDGARKEVKKIVVQ